MKKANPSKQIIAIYANFLFLRTLVHKNIFIAHFFLLQVKMVSTALYNTRPYSDQYHLSDTLLIAHKQDSPYIVNIIASSHYFYYLGNFILYCYIDFDILKVVNISKLVREDRI